MRQGGSKRKTALTAAVLALALALSGCGLQTPEPQPAPDGIEGEQRYAVVDSGMTPLTAYDREMPSIDAEPVFRQAAAAASGTAVQPAAKKTAALPKEVRSVWISYLEMDGLLKDKTASQFRAGIAGVFDNVADMGLNTVVVHVRPFGDALYQSDYFPWSYLITGTEGKDPGFDPLAIMVEEAGRRSLRIEAWVNPYRIRAQGNNNALSADNPASRWLAGSGGQVIRYNGVTSYNPASEQAQKLIVNGVREIVRKYDVDAIHIDDYFYPTTDAAFDAASYESYRGGGGTLALADWRRGNVESLIKQMYSAVKAENPDVLFGISPQSSVNNNYSEQYLDVEKIAATAGYCDYLCPQIYFGFDHDIQPYAQTLAAWDKMIRAEGVELYVGVAVYKAGKPDSWAGSGSREWVTNDDLLSRMISEARAQDTYRGFVLYRYDSIFRPDSDVQSHIQAERANLRALL